MIQAWENWILSLDFRRIPKYQISWKSVQWEPSCSIRTDGQREYRETDMTKSMVAFCNFANAPKNCYIIFSTSCNYLKNVIKGRLQCLIKIISFYYFVLIKDLLHLVTSFQTFILIKDLLHLVNFISNNVLPHDANVLRLCITLIHKLKAVDRKRYLSYLPAHKKHFFVSNYRKNKYFNFSNLFEENRIVKYQN